MPESVMKLADCKRGLVLVTGPTGSGKSTTLASIIDRINKTRDAHVITLEDPIEYLHRHDKSIVNQREIGLDSGSYADALRAALREDPDVIQVGEMRDYETVSVAITAAETGHLVFATLHTNSAIDSVDRIVGVFPEERQPQIRMQLSTTLKAVLSQQLLVRASGHGRMVACEVMITIPAIRNLIREGKTPQMQSSLLSSASEGSLTMDNCLLNMVAHGDITPETAMEACADKEYLKRKMSFR
jgi:twitching motility protein PilT